MRGKIIIAFAVIAAALLGVVLVHSQPVTTTVTNTTTIISPQLQSSDTYAAKFICGVQKDQGPSALYDTQPGSYSTKINVHNNSGAAINFRKKVIWLLKPGPAGIAYNEQPTSPQAKKFDALKPDDALEVVCRDLDSMLGISTTAQPPAYAEGFVIFEVYYQSGQLKPPADPLDVEGIYTYRGFTPVTTIPGQCCGASIDVVTYHAKSNSHVLN
jgi:hypothetical protein